MWLCSMSFTSAELSDTLRLGHSVELALQSQRSVGLLCGVATTFVLVMIIVALQHAAWSAKDVLFSELT